MDINLSISAAPGITTDYLVVAIYEASAPGTLIASQPFAAPHSASHNLSFTGCNPVPHIVIIYQNSTNAPAGTIRHQFIYDPNFVNAQIREDLALEADVTTGFPSTGIGYSDATLKDWTFDIERRGFGSLIKNTEYSWDNTTGTWQLLATVLNPTPRIDPNEIFILHFQPKITVNQQQPAGGGGLFSDSFDITADTVLDSTSMGKCGMIAGLTDHLAITLPLLSTVADNKPIGFVSEGGSHITALLNAAGADSFKFMGGLPTQIGICQCEAIWLFKKNGKWNVAWKDGGWLTVGDIVDQYSKDPAVVLNTVFGNGQVLSRVTYARLYAYMLTLDPSEIVNDSDWNNVTLNNKAKWSTGDGATTFRVPQLYIDGFLRAVDGVTRKAGSHEDQQFPDHRHLESIGELPTGSNPFGHDTTNKNLGRYAGSGNGPSDLASSPVQTDGTAFPAAAVGAKNRPDNTGIYKLIRI